MNKAIVLGAAAAAVLTSGAASAELTANATIASNYIWRGLTQTADQAAGQGGIDYAHGSGLYAGTWVSNIDFSGMGDGYEQDLYVGFGGEAGDFAYDISLATFMYPVTPEFNFTELAISGTFNVVTIGLAYTVDTASGNDAEKTAGASGLFDTGDMYVSASLDFGTDAGDISVYAGSYMFDNSNKSYANGNAYVDMDYIHYGASISKDGFTFALDQTDIDGNRMRATVSYSVDFNLM